ncbi:MAG TPA: translocation/assembly module TamB domain-containing protein [Vicinamibacteria bacterium]|nr:translocation/assembly module TamB domain-containing protein [Vicinamibacteria bacterium]
MKRRAPLAAGALLAALAALAAFGWFPHAPLTRSLEGRLGQALGGTVRIGSLRIVPVLLTVEARDVAIESPALRGRLADVRVEATARALRGEASLRSLSVRGLDLEVRASPRSRDATSAALPPLRIDRLHVDGAVRYQDPALGGDVVVSDIVAQGAVGSGSVDLALGSIRWRREPEPPVAKIAARLEIAPDLGMTLLQAEVGSGTSRLEASGRLGTPDSPAPDVRFDADLDAAEVARLAATGSARGRVHLSGRVRGAAPTSWELKLDAPELRVGGLPIADLRAQASGSAADASATATLGVFGGRVSLAGGRHGDAVELRLEAADLRTGNVPTSFRLEAAGTAAKALELSWSLRGEAHPAFAIEGGGRLDGATFEASGTLAGPSAPAIAGRGSGSIRVVAADGADRSLPFEAAVRVRGQTAEEISLRVPEADLAGLVPEIGGGLSLSADLRGPLDRLGGTVRLDGRGLAYRGIALGALEVRGEGRAADWTVTARLPEHALRLEARSPPPARGGRRVSGTVSFEGTSLAALDPLLPKAVPRDGRLEGRVEFEGEIARPGALVALGDVVLRGAQFTTRLEGRFGAAPSATLDLRVTGSADLAALARSDALEVAGRAEADLRIRGTRLAPGVEGEVRLLGLRVTGAALPEIGVEEARLALGPMGVELKPTVASVAGGSLTASARYPIGEEAPAEVHLEWAGLLAERLFPAQPSGSQALPLSARLSGKADLSGRGATPATWRGEATLTAEAVRAAEMSLEATPLSLRLDGGVLAAAPVTLTSGPGSLTLEGRVDLPSGGLDVSGEGSLDLRALSPLVGTASLTGIANVDVALGGRLDAPEPRGEVVVADAGVRFRGIPEALTNIYGRIVLEAGRVRLEDVSATLGGGEVTAGGEAELRGTALQSCRIDVKARDLNLRYPVGLKTRVDADLVLAGSGKDLVLRGDARVQRGLYDLELALGDAVKAPVVEAEPSPMLRAIGLDVRVVLENPVLIRNRLATLDVAGNLQFRGDLETPAPFGRMDLQGGGKIYVRGRGFSLDEGGGLSYGGDWDPELKVRALVRVPDQSNQTEPECSVSLEGRLWMAQPALACEGLTQGEALSLVATGSSSGGASRLGAQVAGEQAASMALGQLSRGLGFDEVAVQPELLARDTEPGARFTFGKQLTRMLSLIYSLSLQGPEQRFVQLEARFPRGVSLKGQRTDDGFLAAGVGQRIVFGRTRKASASDDRVRLEEVRFEGDVPPEARSAARLKKGKRAAAWDVQEDADRVREALIAKGYVEAEVSGRLQGNVALLRVRTGPRFAWRVVGMPDPPDLREAFRQALYEEDAIERARERLLEVLRERGFLRGAVTAVRAEAEAGSRTLVFEVEPGPALEAEVDFPGGEALSNQRLLDAAGGPGALLADARAALARIEDAYRRAGRLAARAGPVQVDERGGGRVRITVPISEGAPPRIAEVSFEGATPAGDALRQASGLAIGADFRQEALTEALDRLRRHYYELGHAQVAVSVESTIRGPDVEVRFRVREGTATVVGSIEIVGLRRTRESVVRRHILLRPGEPVDPRRLADVERRLLELGVFSSVLVTASPASPAAITVEVVEKDRVELAYDLRWSEDQNTTVQLDGEVRNLVGVGLDLGGRYRYGAEDREKRASLKVPSVGRGKLTASAAETEEDFEDVDIFNPEETFTNTRVERTLELQQSQRVKRFTTLQAGYRFKSTFLAANPVPVHIATLLASGFRETRDNPLDARRGVFAALNIDVSPESLGSHLNFVKGFGQLFLHRRLGAAWTWSQGYRLGLAGGLAGDEVISTERFKAGGPDSLRGFANDSVGPVSCLGPDNCEPAGGNALVVFNQELRYRHRSGWGLAAFWDFGNVFEHVSDLSLDLRHDLGAGLRWASPIGMLRLDLALPLDRRPDEDSYQLHFSLGQIF